MTPAQTKLLALIDEFPKTPNRQLARVAYGKWPAQWTTEDACLNAIRRLRGATGEKNRPLQKRPVVEKRVSPTMPVPRQHFDNWCPFEIPGPVKALVLSDIHVPYHDSKALKVALAKGEEKKANLILLNGDTFDFHAVSRWEKDPTQRDFVGEVKDGRQMLAYLRHRFPRARIVFKWGNHDERWVHFLWQKCTEVLGLDDFELESIMRFEEHRIESVKDMRPIKLGKLNVIHGHEYKTPFIAAVNPARGLFLKAKESALCGHHHQYSTHSDKTIGGHQITCWSTGCLCQLHSDYRPINNQQHGFAFVAVSADGAYSVENYRIINGKCYL